MKYSIMSSIRTTALHHHSFSEDTMTKQQNAYTVAKDGKRIHGTGPTLPAAIRAAEQARKAYEAVMSKRGDK